MINFASIELCILDNKPLEESQCFRTLCDVVGEERARMWVDEITIDLKHPPPGGSRDDTLRDCGLGSGTLGGHQPHDGPRISLAPWDSSPAQTAAAGS